ncbi:MAG: histidine phosphatase family protein [Cognaticolwellia sp.]
MSAFNIYLLRHGALVQSGILCGSTDIALSEIGEQQLIEATKSLPEISQCYSSPLIRCRQFADQYAQQHGLSVQILAELQEMNFGDWDGKSYQTLWQPELQSKLQPELQADQQRVQHTKEKLTTLGDFWQNPWQCQPPNGETMIDFTQRVDHFWQNLLAELIQAKQQQKNILVVSHGGVIRYILAKVLGLPLPGINHMANLDVPYGGLIHLQVSIDDSGKAWPKLML